MRGGIERYYLPRDDEFYVPDETKAIMKSGQHPKEVVHFGMEVLPLGRKHHTEIHAVGRKTFCKKYHVFGIKLDEYLCGIWNLKSE